MFGKDVIKIKVVQFFMAHSVCILCGCVTEKDKNPYTRQRSAPQFRSHGSRLGLSFFTNYIFPGMCVSVTETFNLFYWQVQPRAPSRRRKPP